ncbi:hypothetical protein [Halodesulfovibrio aestuarii]|uniref:Uncharacterized protein n=1 Tax=Halodesulfovibrio aestuarii TaxID=126333 RepID=A0A8G2CB57_9BACT|nr:hypothetical protein [Halodesulfovibrio aestuarii]SHJ47922.1 hypothetical protein SAMN05660830_02537 [Halodesulfovibrio aestuarii]
MENNMLSKLVHVLKKTHAMQVDVYLPSAWKQGIMHDVYAMTSIQRQSPFERFAPQVAMVAVIMLVVVSIPCVLTVNNALSLLDSQLIDAGRDSAQLYLSL